MTARTAATTERAKPPADRLQRWTSPRTYTIPILHQLDRAIIAEAGALQSIADVHAFVHKYQIHAGAPNWLLVLATRAAERVLGERRTVRAPTVRFEDWEHVLRVKARVGGRRR